MIEEEQWMSGGLVLHRSGGVLWAAALMAFAVGCSKGTGANRECAKASDCKSGESCSSGVCTLVCMGGDDCPPGQGCHEGTCGSCTGDFECSASFRCDVALGSCFTSCTNDDACVSDGFCDGGRCERKRGPAAVCDNDDACASGHCALWGVCCPSECAAACRANGECLSGNGEPCTSGVTCASNHCADAVCCDSACDDPCRVCNAAASKGSCTPVVLEEDALCATDASGARACDQAGACLPPHGLFNINKGGGPADFVEMADGRVLFSANAQDSGRELWIADASGPHLLADLWPGPQASYPRRLTASEDGSRVFFVANDVALGAQVWVTDGSEADTLRLTAVTPWPRDFFVQLLGEPTSLTAAFGGLLFAAHSDDKGFELWFSDGTPQGTRSFDINDAGDSLNYDELLVPFGASVIFAASSNSGVGMYRAYNPGGGVVVGALTGGTGVNADEYMPFDGKLYFRGSSAANGSDLFYVDGTSVTAQDMTPTVTDSGSPKYFTVMGSKLFFVATVSGDTELYVHNGSSASKLDIYGGGSSSPYGLAASDSWLYFYADDGGGLELWRTDGTLKQKVSDFASTAGGMAAGFIYPGDTWVLLLVNTNDNGWELWRTSQVADPTAALASTSIVDLWPGKESSDPDVLTVLGDTAYVVATMPGKGRELGILDLPSGDLAVPDIASGGASSYVEQAVVGSSGVFFGAVTDDGDYHTFSLGTSGGMPVDTGPVGVGDAPDTSYGIFGSGTSARNFTLLPDGRIVFDGNDGVFGWELYVIDADFTSVQRITDLWPAGGDGAVATAPVLFGGKLVFVGRDPDHGQELWITDGTASGTHRVSDINPGAADSYPSYLVALSTEVVFSAYNASGDYELYRYNGSVDLVRDFDAATASGNPRFLTAFDNKVYFSASTAANGYEPWLYDPADPAATLDAKVKQLANLGSDASGVVSSNPSNFTVWNGKLYFTASGSLYVSTGAVGNAAQVSGTANSTPNQLTPLVGRLYFSASDSTHGRELWSYPGTGSAAMVNDTNPGTASGGPALLTPVGNRLYYTATDATDIGVYEASGLSVRRVASPPSFLLAGGPYVTEMSSVLDTLLYSAAIDEVWSNDGGRLFVWNDTLGGPVEACAPGACRNIFGVGPRVGGRLLLLGSFGAGAEIGVFP